MTREEICMEQTVHALSRLLNTLDDASKVSTYAAIQERVIRAGGPSDLGGSRLVDLATADLQEVHDGICRVLRKVRHMLDTAENLEELARLRGVADHE